MNYYLNLAQWVKLPVVELSIKLIVAVATVSFVDGSTVEDIVIVAMVSFIDV